MDMRELTPERPRPIHYLDNDDPEALSPRAKAWRMVRLLALVVVLGGFVALVGLALLFWTAGRTPREWAPFLQQASTEQPEPMSGLTRAIASFLMGQDRMVLASDASAPRVAGASPDRSGPVSGTRIVPVSSTQEIVDALESAHPGDVVLLRPGTYGISGPPLRLARPGSPEAPIVLRSERLGDAVIESDAVEAVLVLAPFWRIENLVFKGVCARADDCDHAIHVAGAATDVVIRNNRIEDFNAHIKVNGDDSVFPDRGQIAGNTLIDTAPRAARVPMASIDLVAASDWRISDNLIADFVRAGGPAPTYGAYAKGAGENNVFERNVVICEWRLAAPRGAGVGGQHVGLSLGGGGTDPEVRRDKGQTGFEQIGGSLRDNLIASCSDDGIYLNKAARTVVDRNTVLDTAGIDSRFVETSATVTANIVDGALRSRDGAALQGWDNDAPWLLTLFFGSHPQRGYYRDPAHLDLAWRRVPQPPSEQTKRADLCNRPRTTLAPAGAFETYAACQGSGTAEMKAPVK